jgi:uncharacterized protein YjbI with pentapeptide repeats
MIGIIRGYCFWWGAFLEGALLEGAFLEDALLEGALLEECSYRVVRKNRRAYFLPTKT